MRAVDCLQRSSVMRHDFPDQTLVAPLAIGVQYGFAAGPNSDGFVKVVQRKAFGMQKTTLRFDHILRDQLFRCMAIITRRHGVMTGFFPAVVLIVHDVAVFASRWVIRQIRCALAIPECVGPGHEQQSSENDESLFQGAVPLGHDCSWNGPTRQT